MPLLEWHGFAEGIGAYMGVQAAPPQDRSVLIAPLRKQPVTVLPLCQDGVAQNEGLGRRTCMPMTEGSAP